MQQWSWSPDGQFLVVGSAATDDEFSHPAFAAIWWCGVRSKTAACKRIWSTADLGNRRSGGLGQRRDAVWTGPHTVTLRLSRSERPIRCNCTPDRCMCTEESGLGSRQP